MNRELAEKYICSLCFSAMTNPSDIGCSQQHLFCKSCIKDHLEHESSCPQCNEKCFGDGVKSMPLVRKQIDGLHVRCPNHRLNKKMKSLLSKQRNVQRSATMPATRKSIKAANKRALPRTGSLYSSLDDDEDGCKWKGTLADFEAGKHSCDFTVVTCTKCRKRVLQLHMRTPCNECKQTYVACQKHVCKSNTCVTCGFMKFNMFL